jgi:hypothetical protein
MKRDVFDAIGADLSAAQTEKRRHFVPATIGAISLSLALVAMAGIREDISELGLWRQIAFGASWIVCGFLFPAVGIGIWFPRRVTRLSLIAAGVVLPLCAVLGGPQAQEHPHPAGPCGLALVVLGIGLVGIGALSGAFAQRRAKGSTIWVAAGLTLAGVTTTSVVCPVDEPGHLLWGHVIPGLGFMVAAIVLGRWVHARQRRTGER